MEGVSSSPPFTCGSRRSLLSRTDAVLQAEIRQRVGRTDRMKEASSRRTAGFSFSSYKLQKDTTSTTTQFVGWIVEHLPIFLSSEGWVQLSDCEHPQTDTLLVPALRAVWTGLVLFLWSFLKPCSSIDHVPSVPLWPQYVSNIYHFITSTHEAKYAASIWAAELQRGRYLDTL